MASAPEIEIPFSCTGQRATSKRGGELSDEVYGILGCLQATYSDNGQFTSSDLIAVLNGVFADFSRLLLKSCEVGVQAMCVTYRFKRGGHSIGKTAFSAGR